MSKNERPVILVVDDEPTVASLCQRILEGEGYSVIICTSAFQALAVEQEGGVDLMLVDIRMPGMDGFELLARAREHQPDLAVLIMTGFGTLDIAMAVLRSGAEGMVLKPFSRSELLEAVRYSISQAAMKKEFAGYQALRQLFALTQLFFSERDPEKLELLVCSAISDSIQRSPTGIYARTDDGLLKRKVGDREVLPAEFSRQDSEALEACIEQAEEKRVYRFSLANNDLDDVLTRYNLHSMLVIDLSFGQEKTYLVAARRNSDPPFTNLQVEMFAGLGQQANAALQNARLYTELEKSIAQMENAQKRLIHAEKLAAMGRMTASIAHEINNPLQSLQNCLNLVGRKQLNSQERTKYIQLAQAELARLMAIVRQMLEFYRPGVRDLVLTDVNDLLHKILDLVHLQLTDAHIEVILDFSPDLPSILIVPDQMMQVFLNLILNAVQAMPEGGWLRIKTSTILESGGESGKAKPTRGVEILFCDNGPGVPAEIREHLFEPDISSKQSGTGLGLSISYGIIDNYGGSLSLVQSDMPGACFRIFMPEGRT